MVDDSARWPLGKLLILGPKGSGKSHLLDIWCDAVGGTVWDLKRDQLPDDGARIAIDDVDACAAHADLQTRLFHLHNHLTATNGRLLMASSTPVSQAGFTLPDLVSRLEATAATQISPPDDALIKAMILKHFMDRQMTPSLQVQASIAKYVDRSFEAVADAVAQLDRYSMEQGKKITPGMVHHVLNTSG